MSRRIAVAVVFLAAVAAFAVSRMVPLDDGRTVLIEGHALYIIEGGKRVLAPAGNYMTRDREALIVSHAGVLARSVRRVDGGDPRLLLNAVAGAPWQATTPQDRAVLDAVKSKLETFSQQHGVWFRPVSVNQGAVKLDLMFCTELCQPGIEAQARSVISSVPKVKSVTGPTASTVCYDGFNVRTGTCVQNSTTPAGSPGAN